METIDIIPNIVKGMEFKIGTRVLLNFWGENEDLEVLDKFTLEVAKLGVIPIRVQQSRKFIKEYFEQVPTENLAFEGDYFKVYEEPENAIDIFMYGPRPHKEFPKEKMPLYGIYMRKLFEAMSKNKDIFVQVRVPTEENAEMEGSDFEIYKGAMYQAMSVDYEELKADCTRVIDKISSKNVITIETENNNKLVLELVDRTWQKDDGIGDIPAGEVYIAPIEESVNGSILISRVALDEQVLENVVMEFKAGKLISTSASELIEFIRSFPGDSDIIAEFGIGLNKKVKEITGCIVVDEKAYGTAHIAVGMNTMFGGKNQSQLHMDFIFTPVSIEADGEAIMKGNALLI